MMGDVNIANFVFDRARLEEELDDISGFEKQGRLSLHDIDPKAFGIFLVWLETRDIDASEDIIGIEDNVEREEFIKARWTQFLDLACMTSYLRSFKFHDITMDKMVRLSEMLTQECQQSVLPRATAEVMVLYERFVGHSEVQQLIVDLFMYQGDPIYNYQDGYDALYQRLQERFAGRWHGGCTVLVIECSVETGSSKISSRLTLATDQLPSKSRL